MSKVWIIFAYRKQSTFCLVDITYLSHFIFIPSSWTQLGLAGWSISSPKRQSWACVSFSLSTFLAFVYFLLGFFAPSSLPVPAWCLWLFPSQYWAPGASLDVEGPLSFILSDSFLLTKCRDSGASPQCSVEKNKRKTANLRLLEVLDKL